MNKTYFLRGLILFSVPFITMARQSAMTGIWTLTEKQHLQGPAYANGIPKFISISGETGKTTLVLTTTLGDKDTVELETFEPDENYSKVLMTSMGRQKEIRLAKPQLKNLWIRQVNISARGIANHPEIRIIDSLQLSEDGNYLTLTRNYDGANAPGGNEDYAMVGNYMKITAEQLTRETTTGKGVTWVVGLTWPQILEKARQEKKYVFVDCYATWCGPCKRMDREVFPLNWVGEAMKHQFLAVKIQMDTGKNDHDNIRLTYPIARQLEQQYKVQALPCYLFFDGSGQLVHKEVGRFKTDEFVEILHKAANPSTQLYTRYHQAMAGQFIPENILTLADEMGKRQYGEQDKAKSLIRMFIDKELSSLSDKELLTKENLEIIMKYWWTIHSNDRIFKLFYRDPVKINKILGKKSEEYFAQYRLGEIIWQEEIRPVIKRADSNNTTPDWKVMETHIVRKYGKQYATRLILDTKVRWYQKYQLWQQYCDHLVQQVQMEFPRIKSMDDPSNPMNGLTGLANYLNGAAWTMFLYSNKKEQLETALQWAQSSIDQQIVQKTVNAPLVPTCSTYGNLLYKLGRKEEAITYYQKMVIDRLPKNIKNRTWKNTINRMKQDLPTWEDREAWIGL